MMALSACTIASLEDRRAFESLSESIHLGAPCATWQDDGIAAQLRARRKAIEMRSKSLGLHGAFERGADKADEFLAMVELDCSDVRKLRAAHMHDLEQAEIFLAQRER